METFVATAAAPEPPGGTVVDAPFCLFVLVIAEGNSMCICLVFHKELIN